MTTIILLIASLIGIAGSLFYFRKNLRHIAKKNEGITSKGKRFSNYILTVIWYAYLIIFFLGIFVNNVIFK